MKILILVLAFSISMITSAASLDEISNFASEICEEVEAGGIITREKVKATIEANAGNLIKLVGANISGEGTYEKEKKITEGLPYESLPEQFSDVRACKKYIARTLLEEEKIQRQKANESAAKLDACTTHYVCANVALENLCKCRTQYEEAGRDDLVLSCYKNTNRCWGEDDVLLKRTECDILYQKKGIPFIQPKVGSCAYESGSKYTPTVSL